MKLTDTELAVVLALAGTIAAVVVGWFFYWLGKKERRPLYTVVGNTVVRADEDRHIEVLFKGESVPVVTRSAVAFWNAGREPIRRADLVGTHPLQAKLPTDVRVLDVNVLATTRPQIDFDWVSETDRNVGIDFSFLNRRDGGVIEILHTGMDPFEVKVEGAIVGVDGNPQRIVDEPSGATSVGLTLTGALLGVLAATVPSILGLTSSILGLTSRSRQYNPIAASVVGVVVGVVLVVWLVYLWRRRQVRVPRPLRRAIGRDSAHDEPVGEA
jgi:hypothetical protein